jgi:hypothetical protein
MEAQGRHLKIARVQAVTVTARVNVHALRRRVHVQTAVAEVTVIVALIVEEAELALSVIVVLIVPGLAGLVVVEHVPNVHVIVSKHVQSVLVIKIIVKTNLVLSNDHTYLLFDYFY